MPPSPTQSCFLEKNERQPSAPTVPAWRAGLDVGADRLRGVLDERDPARVAELAQRPDVGGVAAEVHGDHRARARR